MDLSKIFPVSGEVTPENFEEVMQSAIALELATIPTYLSTYYSIKRAQEQEALHKQILDDLDVSKLPEGTNLTELVQELTVDVLVHANKTAALVMSVVIEEMLHLSLASNVKQAIIGAPDIMSIAMGLKFPTFLAGHDPEFYINAAPLSPAQLNTFLQIESPKKYEDPADPTIPNDKGLVEYNTIGGLYKLIINCVNKYYGDDEAYKKRADQPQLVPSYGGKPTPYYSQNSINTVHYDREHNPHFASQDDSGGLQHVKDAPTAVAAMEEIMEQGEGNDDGKPKTLLTYDKDGMPVPMIPDADGKLPFLPGDYDDETGTELSHFAKFMESYSMGYYYEGKFAKYKDAGLKDFYSYFVHNQAIDPKQADYDAYLGSLSAGSSEYDQAQALVTASKLGNAIYTYIMLMVETCYHVDQKTQFAVFMYGIHKSMIWLLSGVGNQINAYSYEKDGETYQGSLTFEGYDFGTVSPKEQIIDLVNLLAEQDASDWGWTQNPQYYSYWQSLPEVFMDHTVTKNVPAIPAPTA